MKGVENRSQNGSTELDLFSIGVPAVNVPEQIAQVNILKILERMVSGSSLLCSEVFVTSLFLLFQIEDLEYSKSFRCEIMKKQPHIISGKS